MPQKITHFLKYNNLATLTIVAVLVGGGSAFAASPELRAVTDSALFGRTETIVAIDNSALLAADLANFDPVLVITAVSEDTESYYVSYTFNTFAVLDGAWRSAIRDGTLTVSKKALGDGDIRAYVSKQLAEVARAEIAFLKEVQEVERKKGETQTVVAVAYTGLLGLIIDPKEKEQEPVLTSSALPLAEAESPQVETVAPEPVIVVPEPVSVDIIATTTTDTTTEPQQVEAVEPAREPVTATDEQSLDTATTTPTE